MEIARGFYLNKLLARKHNKRIKIITGLRRCGKSYLLFKLFKKRLLSDGVARSHIIEIAFDSFENKRLLDPEVLYPYLKQQIKDAGMYYILLDEVQLLRDFEAVLNGLLYLENVDIYVTGSNAKFLSKDVVTEFRGRGDEIRLFPLSFAEFMSVYQGDVRSGLEEYTLFGGLPPVVELKNAEDRVDFLKSLFEETYILDLVGRNKIRNISEFGDLLNILASSIGSLTNPRKLSDTFKSINKTTISPNTVKNYISYLSDAFLIDGAMRFDVKGKKYINTPLKYYFCDLGLRNARLNFRQLEPTHFMENVIYNELKIRGFNVDVGVVYDTSKDKNTTGIRRQYEIDFVCNKGSGRYYIQSAYSVSDNEKLKQEQRSLSLTYDFFKKIIITADSLPPRYNDAGILLMNIYDFLLNPDSLDKPEHQL